jgi:hypothetical protein
MKALLREVWKENASQEEEEQMRRRRRRGSEGEREGERGLT